jgi:histidine triad (HIT) family protein
MAKENCLFCNLSKDKSIIIYEDKVCYVILEKFPGRVGESLVISKKHYNDILATPDEVVAHMIIVAKRVAKHHKKKLAATGVRIIINQGIPGVHLHILHFHIHVLVRYERKKEEYANEGEGAELSNRENKILTKKLKMQKLADK